MADKKRGLGRGLDALLGMGAEQAVQEERNGDQLKLLPIDLIERGKYQPRMDMQTESLQELANSIKAQGIVQPIVVRPIEGSNRFEIIAGERRWRAAQLAGLHEIPALVRNMDDRTAMSIALIENIQRAQLNPLEEANALHRLLSEFEMTHQAIAEAVGRSRAAVTNLLRLRELNDDVKAYIESGELEMGHARALAGLSNELQLKAARQIIANELSVRSAEALVRSLRDGEDGREGPKTEKKAELNPDIKRLQDSLSEQLGAQVTIKHKKNGHGMVAINYGSLDELDGILAHIK
ncbi:MAG: ParB/RepB/Spo0J family partition protein [Gammaproteobacteria bacterium]